MARTRAKAPTDIRDVQVIEHDRAFVSEVQVPHREGDLEVLVRL